MSGVPAVFLDRDGVLNRPVVRQGKPYPPSSVAELVLLPGVAEACAALKRAKLLLIVVTNQPDLARGTTPLATVEAIHHRLEELLPLDEIRVCPHDDADACHCRKPKPGLITDAAAERGIELSRSVVVGDRWRDIDAGRAAGCKTVFVDHGYQEQLRSRPDVTVDGLASAVPFILDTCFATPA